MESYSALAASYDELTQDVGYEKRAAFVEKLFLRSHIPVHTVLDLACGTGTMTALLTERGYELIGVDDLCADDEDDEDDDKADIDSTEGSFTEFD